MEIINDNPPCLLFSSRWANALVLTAFMCHLISTWVFSNVWFSCLTNEQTNVREVSDLFRIIYEPGWFRTKASHITICEHMSNIYVGKENITYLTLCLYCSLEYFTEKAMAPYSSTLAWKIPWTEEPGGPQSMGLLRVGHDWVTSLSLFTFMHWRRK